MCPIAHEFSAELVCHARLHRTCFWTITVCDNVLSQTVQEPLRTHTSAADHLWFVVYHRCLRQEWRVLFVWDPTCFLKKLRPGLYFTLGTVYSELSCAIMWYHKRFRSPLRTRSSAANRLRSAVYHRRFHYDWCMLSDVDRTHSFSWTVCRAIARLKQKYPFESACKKQIRHNMQLKK